MSSNLAISVRGLSKAYCIAQDQEKQSTLAETLLQALRDPVAALRKRTETFWALKDISFDIQKGDVVGVIGRNGAGKSTLLKILSQITEPTSGTIDLYGRVGSLLEVGTGFHPELTGRENVYLNGAILGMAKREISQQFDAIVDFAGVEKFLDTPVKRYSSGMYVRLAFAVAAHLDPEILIVDEVLAVGDAEFQKKCLGKMKDVSERDGRTVIFVSHNMAAVSSLCDRAVLLAKGAIAQLGPTDNVIQEYCKSRAGIAGQVVWEDALNAPGNNRVRLRAVRVLVDGVVSSEVSIDRGCDIEIEYYNQSSGLPLSASIHLLDKLGVEILAAANWRSANLVRDDWSGLDFPEGLFRSRCSIPPHFLNEGRYSFRFAICSNISNVEILTGELLTINAYDEGGNAKRVQRWMARRREASIRLAHRACDCEFVINMKVVILCGGKGTRLREETEFRPKPMVPIGGKPILWHIMKYYAHFGHCEFVLCLGYKGHMIREYFRNYLWNSCDATLSLGNGQSVVFHDRHDEENWTVTLADTGAEAMTAYRIQQIQRYLERGERFLLTYGDGLSNINVAEAIRAHEDHQKLLTISAVHPPGRFGSLNIDDSGSVRNFNEKPQMEEGYVNGGYMVCEYGLFDYLSDDPTIPFEYGPIAALVRDQQLNTYRHEGFWQPMDTFHESEILNRAWDEGGAPWKVW